MESVYHYSSSILEFLLDKLTSDGYFMNTFKGLDSDYRDKDIEGGYDPTNYSICMKTLYTMIG